MTVRHLRPLATLVAVALAGACAPPGPRPIALGKENCRHCHMTIADPRFAAELVTAKRVVYVFDDVGCLLAFVREGTVPEEQVHSLWVYDYLRHDSLLDALRPGRAADSLHARLGGEPLAWDRLPAEGHGG